MISKVIHGQYSKNMRWNKNLPPFQYWEPFSPWKEFHTTATNQSFALLHCCHILNCQRVLFKTVFFCYNLQLHSFHLTIIKRKQRSFFQNYNEIFLSIWASLTRSLRANETKIWGFKFRIESGKGCRGKQNGHSYSKFEKQGVFIKP